MRPLSQNDIESELSYAYLHAVVSRIGANCEIGTRHEDNNGIDAKITAWGPFPAGGYLEEIDLKIQLKATIAEPNIQNGHISYFLNGTNRYDDLRADVIATHRILVVMFLPRNQAEWLELTTDQLILKKCAYWVSLRGAAASTNKTGETIYIPENQLFNPDNLREICRRLSRREFIQYVAP